MFKIKKEKKINESIWSLIKKRKLKNIKIPPVKGIFFFEANFWCLSPVSLIKKFFLIKKLFIDNKRIISNVRYNKKFI